MKRFYKHAAAAPTEGGFTVTLDGKPMRTPGKAPLVVPTQALAAALAEEWQAQTGEMEPLAMPLTRLAATAIDRVAVQRAAAVDEIVAYAGSDLVCYRAAEPAALVARQAAVWQPLVDWLRQRYDVALAVTTGIVPCPQPARVAEAIRAVVESFAPLPLTALHALTTAAGSVVIGLAAMEGRLDAGGVFAAAQLDEDFQIERWGEQPESTRRRQALRRDIEASCRFAALLRR
jgi:chaperone required for assembly of F1-ATPase